MSGLTHSAPAKHDLLARPARTLPWPHWQRLTERWWRRWGFASLGLALGATGVSLLQTEAQQDHALAVQAVAQLRQQLSAPVNSGANQRHPPLSAEQQRMWDSLPDEAQPGQIWADLQEVLVSHGLRLVSLRPLPPAVVPAQVGHLPSHAAALRLSGRFEDWSRVWSALKQAGPVCSIDKLNVVATTSRAEVHIEAVLRIWMRPATSEAQHIQPRPEETWPASVTATHVPASPAASHVFAHADLERPPTAPALNPSDSAGAPALAAVSASAVPENPEQWPWAHVRLVGLWQQGSDRQAILSAGPHWARVTLGQRVSQEGHRVVAITDAGVHVHLAPGPRLALDWRESPTAPSKEIRK